MSIKKKFYISFEWDEVECSCGCKLKCNGIRQKVMICDPCPNCASISESKGYDRGYKESEIVHSQRNITKQFF